MAVFSNRYFPNYIGGGERLAELTVQGFIECGLPSVVLTCGQNDRIVQREWKGVSILELPSRFVEADTKEPLAAALVDVFNETEVQLVHIVGHKGALPVAEIASRKRLPTCFAATSYGLFCNTETLVRRDGEVCKGRASRADCFRCRTASTRPRDRMLATIGSFLPAAATGTLTGIACHALGTGRLPQVQWWQQLCAFDRRHAHLLSNLMLVVHGTEYSREQHERVFGQKPRNITIHHPIALRDRVERKPHFGALRVGFIGRLLRFKGVHVLIEAVAGAAKKRPVELHVFAAKNEDSAPERRALEALADLRRIDVCWHEMGHLTEDVLDEIHAGLDVLVVPSLWPEYVGFVSLEALIRGTPLVLSEWPPQRELFGKEASVKFVPAGDADRLADVLVQFSSEILLKVSPNLISPKAYAHQLLNEIGIAL